MGEVTVKSSDEAFRLIHRCLGDWVAGSLEDGFIDDPLDASFAANLMTIAGLMRDIESHTDIASQMYVDFTTF